MIKAIALILSIFSALPTFAAKAKEGGTVYICANSDNSIKFTADLSDQASERSAVVVYDGETKVYYEMQGKKQVHPFLVGAQKNSVVQVKKEKAGPVVIALDTDPETIHSQLEHQSDDMSVSGFIAYLTVPKMQISRQQVSCRETKWTF